MAAACRGNFPEATVCRISFDNSNINARCFGVSVTSSGFSQDESNYWPKIKSLNFDHSRRRKVLITPFLFLPRSQQTCGPSLFIHSFLSQKLMVAVDTVIIYKNTTAIKIITFISKTFKIDHTITYQTWIQWPFYSKQRWKNFWSQKQLFYEMPESKSAVWTAIRSEKVCKVSNRFDSFYIFIAGKTLDFYMLSNIKMNIRKRKKIRIVISVNAFFFQNIVKIIFYWYTCIHAKNRFHTNQKYIHSKLFATMQPSGHVFDVEPIRTQYIGTEDKKNRYSKIKQYLTVLIWLWVYVHLAVELFSLFFIWTFRLFSQLWRSDVIWCVHSFFHIYILSRNFFSSYFCVCKLFIDRR